MTSSESVFNEQCQSLNDSQTGWSIGTFGAIAEFNRQPEETVSIMQNSNCATAVTNLGSLQLNHHPEACFLPYESLSKFKTAWSQGVVICLPEIMAHMANNAVITDMGEDDGALSNIDGGRLFDLGLSVFHVDTCVRTNDQSLIRTMEKYTGTRLFGEDNAVFEILREANPARVFQSKLGRIEVYQPIPSPDSGSVTPDGPHTHLMPELLAYNRTHAANIPVPKGWLPCLALYPPNPIRNGFGDIIPFDHGAFERFQDLIQRYASSEIADVKAKTFEMIEAGNPPKTLSHPTTRAERTALRIALRQVYHLHGPSDCLAEWVSVYEPTA